MNSTDRSTHLENATRQPTEANANHAAPAHSMNFQTGDHVIYHIHGRCQIVGLEERQIGGQSVPFYRIEAVRSQFARTVKKEPAIWVPVHAAKQQGMRAPLSAEGVPAIMAILSSRETYFSVRSPWNDAQAQMNKAMIQEGAAGIAKALSCAFGRMKLHVLAPSVLQKYFEQTLKLLVREISDATQETAKDVEENIRKALKNKSIADN